MKEIWVYRDPPFIKVFDFAEHGRRHYRQLAWVSDTIWSLGLPADTVGQVVHKERQAPLTPGEELPGSREWTISAGVPNLATQHSRSQAPTDSVLITRMLSAQRGPQLHIPRRFLAGHLPDALLERYSFWQRLLPGDDDGSSAGHADEKAQELIIDGVEYKKAGLSKGLVTSLKITIAAGKTKAKFGEGTAIITRPLAQEQQTRSAPRDSHQFATYKSR